MEERGQEENDRACQRLIEKARPIQLSSTRVPALGAVRLGREKAVPAFRVVEDATTGNSTMRWGGGSCYPYLGFQRRL